MSESGKVIAAYYTSWSIYARAYNVTDIDSDKMTHLLYAFANLKPDGEVFLGDAWADTDKHFDGDSWNDVNRNLYGNFKQLGLLKKKTRNFKVSLSIGGWSWSTNFPVVASKSDSRKKFVTSSINLLKDLGLDGLDVDWEYPRNGEDAKNYVKLLKELREALDDYSESRNHSCKLLLTAAMPCGEDHYRTMNLKEMNKYLDIFYLMAYDFRGSWSSKTGHQSNLYGGDLSTHKAVEYYINKGVANNKLVIGMPMYGRAFQNTRGLGSSYDGVGDGTWEQGIYDYKKLPRQGAVEHFDENEVASYSYSASDKEFVTYDNPQVIIQKTDYIKHNHLRGVMFWELSGDFPTSHERSLLTAAYHGLGGKDALDQTPNHRSFPDSIYENVRNGFE
ncbi:Glycoside Hydrolase Family 18 protein [Glomus cerebriforme]|uniref:chitinase n=1 Tax=Glomus cerebriforme TaxID=658196 RepID=A0A397SKG0_9GLOM|nr:Glycoside Hydrolase Family 18 protein [Glomus cerebriforme]